MGIALALQQSAHISLRRRGEQQHLSHPVRQCPDVHDVGARIFAAYIVLQRHSMRRGLFNFIPKDVFEFGPLPFEHQTLRVRLVHLSLGREEGLHHAVMRALELARLFNLRQGSITFIGAI